jgi:hypothetical protein
MRLGNYQTADILGCSHKPLQLHANWFGTTSDWYYDASFSRVILVRLDSF